MDKNAMSNGSDARPESYLACARESSSLPSLPSCSLSVPKYPRRLQELAPDGKRRVRHENGKLPVRHLAPMSRCPILYLLPWSDVEPCGGYASC